MKKDIIYNKFVLWLLFVVLMFSISAITGMATDTTAPQQDPL